jgi:EAL domain-containing protein (putative c-di-GMP-specific phosphodiesterase class I)
VLTSKHKLIWTLAKSTDGPEQGVRRLGLADLGVAFQPIVDIATGRVFAHEALVRPKSPEYPSPPALFEAAEKELACGRIGRLIREVAFGSCGDVPLFVNLHAQELSSRWIVQSDDPMNFHTKPVYLEVTETSALTHFELCRDVLADLRRRSGAELVVDDFGAGYSNLERVVDLMPAVIKLDLALIRDIEKHRPRQIVVRHMVNMCKELGARVVAEGVETVDELACVRDLGVDYAQGYLLARPAAPPPEHFWPFEVSKAATAARRGPPPLPKMQAGPPPPEVQTGPPPVPRAARRSTRPRGSKSPPASRTR